LMLDIFGAACFSSHDSGHRIQPYPTASTVVFLGFSCHGQKLNVPVHPAGRMAHCSPAALSCRQTDGIVRYLSVSVFSVFTAVQSVCVYLVLWMTQDLRGTWNCLRWSHSGFRILRSNFLVWVFQFMICERDWRFDLCVLVVHTAVSLVDPLSIDYYYLHIQLGTPKKSTSRNLYLRG